MWDVFASMACPVIQSLLKSLISLGNEEISLIWNFKKDLDKLAESLGMIRDFLDDAEKKQVTNKAVKRWLINLEAVAFDADNVLDELNYEVHRRKMGTTNKLKKKVRANFSTQKMALDIKSINEKLNSINKEATDLGIQAQLSACDPVVESNLTLAERETASNWDSSLTLADRETASNTVVGRENYVSSIVQILTHNEQEVFSVLPIVGMGGVGKTTLAKLVFHDKKIEAHFGKRIWVYVSESFDEMTLLKKILESLTGSSKDDSKTKDNLVRKLREKLEAKNYLLVLDDVWTEEKKKWDDFVDTLSSITSEKGNGIIVTTRSERIALFVGTIRIQKLGGLSDEDCWSMIKEKTFGNVIPFEFEAIGRKIATKCQGLPFAAKVMGALLCRKPIGYWYSIERHELSNFDDDGNTVRKILKLIFDNLPSHSLKKCFAFCAIFPKGYEISRERLIHLWMAEGFLQSDDTETLGDKYFDFLLQNSLLEVAEPFRWMLCYTMHDLVWDLAFSVLSNSGPIRCIYAKSITDITDISKEGARNVRSLIFEGRISDENMLSDFKYLRGLVLIGYGNAQLPKIEHLIHLRYLDMFDTSIECSPTLKLIGNLYLLHAFRARIASNELPKALKKSINLRHVYIDGIEETRAGTELGLEVVASPCLKYLGLLPFQIRTSGTSLFPNLKTLYIGEMRSGPFLENLLVSTTSLTKLQFQHLPGPVRFPAVFFRNNQNLTYLKICLCGKIYLPPRFGVALREVEIDCCLDLKGLPENVHCLDKLLLRGCPNIKSIPYNRSSEGSPSLRELKITHCDGLTGLPIGLLESCSSSLESVYLESISSVTNMGMVIDCLQKMPRLTSLRVDLKQRATDNFPTETIGSFDSLRDLWISCGMEIWQRLEDLLQHLNALRKLTLSEIEIEAVPEWLGKLPYLHELHLDGCPRLRSLPSKKALEKLTRLKVVSCPLLNLQRDDDNSEWHKVSHIADVYPYQLSSEQVKVRGAMIQKGTQTEPTDILDQASTSWSTSKENKSLKSENEKLKTEMSKLQRDFAELQQEHQKLNNKQRNSF